MKSLILSSILMWGIILAPPIYALPGEGEFAETALESADAVTAMTIANQWRWSKKGLKSFVNPREVVFQFAGDQVKKVPLPEEKMMVAVAPYKKETHPCFIHHFSSCQAELAGQAFSVKAVDQEGNVLVDQSITTLKNGFFELWLPRDRKIELSVRQGDLTAKGEIETSLDSKTCVTTLQMQ